MRYSDRSIQGIPRGSPKKLTYVVSKFAFLKKSWYDISVLVTFTPFLFSYGYRNPHTPDDSSKRDHRMYSHSISSPSYHSWWYSSHRISQVSRRRSPRSRIPGRTDSKSPSIIGGFFMQKKGVNIAKIFWLSRKKSYIDFADKIGPSENASTTRRSCEVSRDNSWSSGRRDTIRLYRTKSPSISFSSYVSKNSRTKSASQT